MDSPTTRQKHNLVFAAGEICNYDNDIEHDFEEHDLAESSERNTDPNERRPSMYTVLLDDMIKLVLPNEAALFEIEDYNILKGYSLLEPDARYLLARLLLRKPDTWHRLSKLKYRGELGNNLQSLIDKLCSHFSAELKIEDDTASEPHVKPTKETPVQVKAEPEMEVNVHASNVVPSNGPKAKAELHAAYGSDNGAVAGPSHFPGSMFSDVPYGCGVYQLCRDETSMTLAELLHCLTVDELKQVAKQLKIKTKQTRSSLISALLTHSSTQTTLNFASSSKGKSKGKHNDHLKQTTLKFPIADTAVTKENIKFSLSTQEHRLKEMVVKILGKCVKVTSHVFALFRRIHVVYFRSTEFPDKILLPSLMTAFKKRTYAAYSYKRSNEIWKSREDLLLYEEALYTQARVESVLDGTITASGRASKTPIGLRPFVTPAAPARSCSVTTPQSASSTVLASGGSKDHDEVRNDGDGLPKGKAVAEAEAVMALFAEIYPKWKELVARLSEDMESRPPGLERFESGHIYTRLVFKGAHALGVLKDHAREIEVLEELLQQRRWRRGSRGKWYDRRALVLNKYFLKGTPNENEEVLKRIHAGLLEALSDTDTGIVYRPSLIKRLLQVEKRLKLPPEDRCRHLAELKEAQEVFVEAVRVWDRGDNLVLDSVGRVVGDDSAKQRKLTTPLKGDVWRSYRVPGPAKNADGEIKTTETKPCPVRQESWRGKSIWRGKDGEDVNVETCALQYYESLGYKGFHSETSILTTLFGLLFWDIIFADIPGAFETPFQTAPLDLAEDTFYFARKELIDKQLDELRQGRARQILEHVDAREREQATWCVGVRWDLCSREDLVEIVECLNGEPLAIICQLFCEDYTGRSGGVPDLIVWNAATKSCKFVEVKGPGDRLQNNQQVWVDVLLRARADVEICKVVEQGKPRPRKKMRTVKKPRKKAAADSDLEMAGEGEEVDEVDDTPRRPVPDFAVVNGPWTPPPLHGKKRPVPDDDDILPVFALSTRTIDIPSKRLRMNRVEVVVNASPRKGQPLSQ